MKNAFKNLLLRFLHLFFRKRRSQPPSWDQSKVLVISTTALGDTLWGTAAIKAFKQSYPNSKIYALSSPVGCKVLENQPEIEEIYHFPNNAFFSIPSLLTKLRKQKFDAVLVFHASDRLAIFIGGSLGASEVIGTKGLNKGLDSFFTHVIPWDKTTHEIERRLDMTSYLGAKKQYALSYRTTQEEEAFADDFLKSNPNIVALHPGAKDSYKCWPKEKFIELGKLLQQKNIPLLITGVKEEHELISSIAAALPGSKYLPAMSLRQFAAILKKMALVITNDTGPLHLAIAVQTPVLALFAPTNPKICGPYHAKNAHVIQKPITCKPCLRRSCRYPFCLLQISPVEVFHYALKMLSDKL